jgi:hypothetical protein
MFYFQKFTILRFVFIFKAEVEEGVLPWEGREGGCCITWMTSEGIEQEDPRNKDPPKL